MMTMNSLFKMLMLLALMSMATVSCGKKPENPSRGHLDSVDVEQTEVKDQYRVGFCWAYATVGLIESKHLMTTGEKLDLSEEAIGFYRMAEALLRIGQAQRRGEISADDAVARATAPGKMEGWYVRAYPGSRDAMELVDTYGLVPESDWSFKFQSSQEMSSLLRAIGPAFRQVLDSNETLSIEAMARVLTARGAFPSVPPKLIHYQGQVLSATEFARNILRFRSGDYVSLSANQQSDTPRLVAALKRSLARGVSVPLGFTFDPAFLDNGVFRSPEPGESLSLTKGGHAVLVSDFVNRGGVEGALPAAELRQEVEKAEAELDFLKFKNSWGLNARENESGVPVTAGSQGYYYMQRGYLEAAAAASHLSIVVDREIAADPFGPVEINPNVTSGR